MIAQQEFVGPLLKKKCPICLEEKPLESFHRQLSGRFHRHSYCAVCACQKQRESRVRNYSVEQKRRWQRRSRYGLTDDQYKEMLISQRGKCAICGDEPQKLHVDHCHNTGAIRGLLCHRCNIRLGGWDDPQWRDAALNYMGIKTIRGAE